MPFIPSRSAISPVSNAGAASRVPSGVTAVPLRTAGFPPPPHLPRLSTIRNAGIANPAASLPPWLANGVVFQLPQAWVLGFTNRAAATQYLIGALGFDYSSLLWLGYLPAYATPEFTIDDVFTAFVRAYNNPTLFIWISRNALPYANYIVSTNFGLTPTIRSGPIVPAAALASFRADSSAGTVPVALQYVQYVPDVSVTSGNPAWIV